MRVLLSTVLAGLSILVVACSSASPAPLKRSASANTDDGSDPLGNPDATDTSKTPTSSSPPAATPTPTPAQTTPTPAPSTTTTPATPAPPAAPAALGSCGNPKCAAGGGLSGCKATDSAGHIVTMGCQDGECACFAGQNATSTFESDEQTADEAKNDFLTNCDCN